MEKSNRNMAMGWSNIARIWTSLVPIDSWQRQLSIGTNFSVGRGDLTPFRNTFWILCILEKIRRKHKIHEKSAFFFVDFSYFLFFSKICKIQKVLRNGVKSPRPALKLVPIDSWRSQLSIGTKLVKIRAVSDHLVAIFRFDFSIKNPPKIINFYVLTVHPLMPFVQSLVSNGPINHAISTSSLGSRNFRLGLCCQSCL